MAQHNPAAPRLFALPAATGADPGNADPGSVTQPVTGPVTLPLTSVTVTSNTAGTDAHPEATVAVVPLTVPERASLAVTHWGSTAANGAGQLWLNPGRILHALWYGRPETMAEHRAYIKSRAWVPKELGGKSRKVVVFLGVAYHLLIARPIKAAARTVDASAERPLRLLMLTAFVSVFAVAVLPHIPLPI